MNPAQVWCAVSAYVIAMTVLSVSLAHHIHRSIVWPAEYDNARDPQQRQHWQAGDLLIMANDKGNSIAINLFSSVPWTHIGILIPVDGVWFLWHSDSTDTRLDATACDAPRHTGVQLTPLDYLLATTESVAHRIPQPPGLRVPHVPALAEQVMRECNRGRRVPFDSWKPRLLAVALSSDPKNTWTWLGGSPPENAYFCSAFVAEMYRRWGWDMDGASTPYAFHPKHFLKYIR